MARGASPGVTITTCCRPQNPRNCGEVGQPCCISTGAATTNYLCKPGGYCPIDGAAAVHPTCSACPPAASAEQQSLWFCSNPVPAAEVNAPV